MPTTSASKAAVRSISVEDKPGVRKWVNYSAHYSYKVASGGSGLMFPKSICSFNPSPSSFQQILLMSRNFTLIAVDKSAPTLMK